MYKKLTLIVDGSPTSVNQLLGAYLKTCNLNAITNLFVNLIDGIGNAESKTAFNVLVYSATTENNLINKISDIKSNHKRLSILLFSNFLDADFIGLLFKKGISGHISMFDEISEFNRGIQTILSNEIFYSHHTNKLISDYYSKAHKNSNSNLTSELSPTEKIVLRYLLQGLTSPQVADILFKSVKTINSHRQHIYDKIGFHNISDLIIWAHRNNFNFEN